jgi:hypothetical protein
MLCKRGDQQIFWYIAIFYEKKAQQKSLKKKKAQKKGQTISKKSS